MKRLIYLLIPLFFVSCISGPEKRASDPYGGLAIPLVERESAKKKQKRDKGLQNRVKEESQ